MGRKASDVHVQPLEDRALVRYRVDGQLHTHRELPRKLAPSVVSRIKVMAQLDIAELGHSSLLVTSATWTTWVRRTSRSG